MTSSDDENDGVGYRRPPRATRFKKGQSGNPQGRPRRARNIATELRVALDAKIAVRENGKAVKLSKGAALAKSIVARALNGDMRAFDAILRILPDRFATIEPPDTQQGLTADEQAIVERLVTRRLNQAAHSTQPRPTKAAASRLPLKKLQGLTKRRRSLQLMRRRMTNTARRTTMNDLSQRELDILTRSDFTMFAERALLILVPGYCHFPYVALLCAYLRAMVESRLQNLVVNLPPRHGKSAIGIAFVAFYLGKHPDRHVIVASHSEILAKDLASKTMDLMQSDFYARIFPETKIRPDAAPVMDFKTTAGGGRLAAGMTTSVTGRGTTYSCSMIRCQHKMPTPQKSGKT